MCSTKTLIVMLLDESGSMQETRSNIMEGFNSLIDEQKALEGDKGRIILIKFSNKVKIVYNCVEVADAPRLTEANYKPNGSTALYDGIKFGIDLAKITRQESE